jgi:hypothetical protein
MTVIPSERDALRETESVPVQLANIAGDIKLVLYRVGDVAIRVDRHETEINTLKSQTQSLKEGAVASTEKAEALALALKEAKEAVEATALQESNKAQAAERERAGKEALGWSPITKLFAVIAGALVLVQLYQALRPGGM